MCARKIWAGQGKNLLVTLASLGVLFAYFWLRGAKGALGDSSRVWLWGAVAVAIPILHQQWVWLFWRLELYMSWFTRHWGFRLGFGLYGTVFFLFFFGRVVALAFLARFSRGSLALPQWSLYTVAGLITLPVVYLAWSVKRYFTISRALGVDHFDKDYCEPFERRGIFKYTNNGMYIYGLLFLFYPALIYASEQALVVALFNYGYIWAHYFFTEYPDMAVIYGSTPEA